jgi:hypothetical protein
MMDDLKKELASARLDDPVAAFVALRASRADDNASAADP